MKPYIIAETACAHDGSIKRLKKMIDCIGFSSASAIQFRIFKRESTITKFHPEWSENKKLEISFPNWKNIFKYVRKKFPKLEIISSIPSLHELKFVKEINTDAFKLHSADLNNYDLLREMAKIGKRIDLSVGASTIEEIENYLKFIKKINPKCEIWLMYGYQLFPTIPNNLNLNLMIEYQKKFKLKVGYQDHSNNFDHNAFSIPAVAIGMGINIIEKHITDDLKRKGTDYESAIEAKKFKNFVDSCNAFKASLGDGKKKVFNEDEKKYRLYCKKNIFVNRELKANTRIKKKYLILKRSNKIGILADDINIVVGKKVSKKILKSEQIFLNSIKQ